MIEYLLLGIAQGLTEFFPVSSSGHLVLLQKVFGLSGGEVALSIVLHLGTLVAVMIFFFQDILKALKTPRLLFYIFVVTLITGIIGILAKDFFEGLFSSVKFLPLAWFFTAGLLWATRKFRDNKRGEVSLKDAIILGFTQAVAIIPGVSRSGMTISTLLFRKLDAKNAFSFSFIVSLPLILGAALLEAREIDFAIKVNPVNLASGFIFSLLAGLVSLWMLKKILIKAKFHYFAYYCLAAAAITLVLEIAGRI
jgi:undecaprenyl-diphosphatase